MQSESGDGFQVFGERAGNEEKPGAACGAQVHAAVGRPGHECDEASQVSDWTAAQQQRCPALSVRCALYRIS